MNRFFRFWNQKRIEILFIVIFVAFLFAIIQILNYFAGKENKNQKVVKENVIQNYSDISIANDKSLLTNKDLTEKQEKSDIKLINEFVSFCNKKEYEKAYEMVSDDCKKELFGNVDEFIENYYKDVFFGQTVDITAENWIDNIYRINIRKSALNVGKKTDSSKVEYITVLDNGKLNVNQFIGKKELNKSVTNYGVTMTVMNQYIFMDYMEFDISIKNETESNILVDTKRDTESMYITDSKGNKFYSYNHEIPDDSLNINRKDSKNVRIKYYSKYTSKKEIKSLVFSDVVLNYTNNISSLKAFNYEIAL